MCFLFFKTYHLTYQQQTSGAAGTCWKVNHDTKLQEIESQCAIWGCLGGGYPQIQRFLTSGHKLGGTQTGKHRTKTAIARSGASASHLGPLKNPKSSPLMGGISTPPGRDVPMAARVAHILCRYQTKLENTEQYVQNGVPLLFLHKYHGNAILHAHCDPMPQ